MADRERVGVIGWSYPEWKGKAYPKGAKPADLLREYAKLFPIVEVASSFYRAPEASTVAQWDADAPRGFELSLKVPDRIVRKPGAPGVGKELAAFVERLEPLKRSKKLGVLVAQFPATFKREKREADLRALVAALPAGARWAVELRHDSWWHKDTYRLLEDADAVLAWSSVEQGRTPPVVTSDRLYLRLFLDKKLAPPWGTKRRDATKELAYWAERVRDEGASAKKVDILVSKFLEGYAPASAATMVEMLKARPRSASSPAARRSRSGARSSRS